MGFNLKRFLRRVSPEMLRQYLDARKISLSDRVDWEDPAHIQPDVLLGAITALVQFDREIVITDFENVELLCDIVGQRALHSVAARDARVFSLLQSADSNVAKSITLLLADDRLFEHALAARYADHLLMGRSWSAFRIDTSASSGFSFPNLPAFEAELAMVLARSDGSIGKLKIDSFERSTVTRDGRATGRTVHCAIYSEDLPVADVEFADDELKRETRRPVREGAILYDTDGKTLDVVTSGGKAVRDRIADSFVQNILGIKGKIHPVVVQRFALDRLRRPIEFESDAADGIKTVKVTLLHLARAGSRYERVTIEVDPSDRTNICSRSTQWFGDADPLKWPDWHVTHATLRLVFYPDPGRTREKIVSFELRAPNGSNLRDQTLQHQIVSQKYLAKWGLLAVAGR
jgi:hypothetical protein